VAPNVAGSNPVSHPNPSRFCADKLAVLKARQPGVPCGLAFMFLEVMTQLLAYTLIEQNPHSSLCRQELLRFFERGDCLQYTAR
jgi:hypothetical protein